MMRALFSGVSGLKSHQTRMDVIGNNIANVNTVAYKSQSMTFSEVFYQTTQTATGPNADTGKGGTNAMQIGLGSSQLRLVEPNNISRSCDKNSFCGLIIGHIFRQFHHCPSFLAQC